MAVASRCAVSHEDLGSPERTLVSVAATAQECPLAPKLEESRYTNPPRAVLQLLWWRTWDGARTVTGSDGHEASGNWRCGDGSRPGDHEQRTVVLLYTQCRIRMLERVNRHTKDPFWGRRRHPSCKITRTTAGQPRTSKPSSRQRRKPTTRSCAKFLPAAGTSSAGSWVRAGAVQIDDADFSETEETVHKDVSANFDTEAEMARHG